MNYPDEKNTLFQMRFPQKLWYLLNLRTEAILWGGTGRTILLNYKVLHTYLQCDKSIFKTTNISSFVRQLNLYGFRKVTSHLQDPLCNSSNPYLHEYVHDYFQFGRPELLNKLNRKALTGKRCFKSMGVYDNSHGFSTPLQKARLAFRMALKKAAHDLYTHDSQKEITTFECDENDQCEDEDSFDWLQTKEPESILPDTAKPEPNENSQSLPALNVEIIKDEKVNTPDNCENENDGHTNMEDSFMNFQQELQQNNQSEQYPDQFLSMPDLNQETTDQGVELLAEFNINQDMDQGIIKAIGGAMRNNDTNSLNCVLPSVNDQFDDVAMAERSASYSSYNNSEWDQMFNEIMTNKSTSQEGASDMRELYFQISRTIDLLNS